MKNKILECLKGSYGYVSGEKISNSLNVSRTTIWKNINKLRELGYKIESSSKKGYKLLESPDILTEEEIKPLLTSSCIGKRILHYEEINSTNDKLRILAKDGENEGTVVIANSQTDGKGRLQREWISDKDKNIYMSMLIKPNIPPYVASGITQVVAISVVKALETIYNLDFSIKWPNDIILNGKKVCGILTEMDGEIDKLNYIIIGIGVNVNQEIISEEIKDKATSLLIESKKNADRRQIIASILNEFEKNYNIFKVNGISTFVDKLKNYSALMNKRVKVSTSYKTIVGDVIDIDNEGYLVVRTETGEIKNIISGDISIRGENSYLPD